MFAFQKGIKKPLGLHLLWAVSHVIYYFLSEKLLLRMFTLNKTLQYLVESKILLSSYELQGRAAVEILLVWTLIFTLNAYRETQQLLWIQGDASLQKAPTGSGSIHQLLSHMEVLQGSSMVHDNIRLINIPKWGKQSVCYRSELLCRGTWKGLEKGACDVQGWSTRACGGGGGLWTGSAWKRWEKGEISLLPATACWEGAETMEPNSSQWWTATGWDATNAIRNMGNPH